MDFEETNTNSYARALFDNIAEIPRELTFKKGDILTVLQGNYDNNPEWWVCSLRNKVGLAPANRLEAMPDLILEKQTSDSTYDNFPDQSRQEKCYMNMTVSDNPPKVDDTYCVYQLPQEDEYIDPLTKNSNNQEHVIQPTTSQSSGVLDDTYSDLSNQNSANFSTETMNSDVPDRFNNGSSGIFGKTSESGDYKVNQISPEEAIARYKLLQNTINDNCNNVLEFVKGKWKTEEMLKVNVNSLRKGFLQMHENLVTLIHFSEGVYQNSLNCTDVNLTKKINKQVTQLQENRQAIEDALQKLTNMDWEPEKIAISVRLAVTEGSDPLAQMILAARDVILNTRSLSITINGNATILFPATSLTSDRDPGVNTHTTESSNQDREIVQNTLKLFVQQIQTQSSLVKKAMKDFSQCLLKRNTNSHFVSSVTSNSKFVIRSATQLVCIGQCLSECQLKSVPCSRIEMEVNRLRDSIKGLVDLTKMVIKESGSSGDFKTQLSHQLDVIEDSVHDLLGTVVNDICL